MQQSVFHLPATVENMLILSDLHLEFGAWTPNAPPACDLVILAGDIHIKERGFSWARETFPTQHIVYVMGNHEYYGGNVIHSMDKARKKAEEFGIFLLEKQMLQFHNIRILGATLWTDYKLTNNEALAKWDAQQTMNDHRKIRDGHYRRVRPDWMQLEHYKTRTAFEQFVSTPFEGATIIVTHHAPSFQSIPPRYKNSTDHLNAAYASDLESFIHQWQPQLWVHGHIHDSFTYTIGSTQLYTNPRGYHGVEINPNFSLKTIRVHDLLDLKKTSSNFMPLSQQELYEHLFAQEDSETTMRTFKR